MSLELTLVFDGLAHIFFLLNIFTQDYPLGWVPLQMRGPARNISSKHTKKTLYNMHTRIYITYIQNMICTTTRIYIQVYTHE